jgi:DNA-binding response OmpR family regulator
MSDEPYREAQPMKVLLYSHDAGTRDVIRLAIGRRPAPDVPRAEIIECATEPSLWRRLDRAEVDIMILDGEAQPAGGMGVCRQAKDEIYNCPPVLLVIGRADDGWLATWSRADAVVSQPVDPAALATELAGLMRLVLSRRSAADGAGGGAGGPAAELTRTTEGASGTVHGHDAVAQA